jgi:hypothetical protein
MDKKDATLGRFVEMRQIALAVCQEMQNELDLRTTVEALCWLALWHGSKETTTYHDGGPMRKKDSTHNANPGLNLLTAAAHFDLLSLAQRLLAEGHNPTSHNYLFAPPI